MTHTDFKILEQKIDKIIEQNDEILFVFRKVALYPKDPLLTSRPKKQKNDWTEQFVQDYFRAMPHKKSLQKIFNLVAIPSTERVLKYLVTNDPNAFEGLKQKISG